MAATLFKLAITATSDTTSNAEVYRYFHLYTSTDRTGNVITIAYNDFLDDTGGAVSQIVAIPTDSGYYSLYMNGVLQQSGLYQVTPGGSAETAQVEITVDAQDVIEEGTPIVLVATTIEPSTATTVNT